MEFRPCIDIHNGKVKQIIGSSLTDRGNQADANFISPYDAAFYASFYRKDQIKGGHVILLNPAGSKYYDATKRQALQALKAYPKGLQVGGGIHTKNAEEFLRGGASHVIVTSYVFSEGKIHYERLKELSYVVGKERLVLDVSCRKQGDDYYIVTDRWQKFTKEKLTEELLDSLKDYGDEFLVHAVDVEGKSAGIEKELAAFLGAWGKIPITYAGGIRNFEDLRLLKEVGKGKLNATIGSALDLFGGTMAYQKVLAFFQGAKEGRKKEGEVR